MAKEQAVLNRMVVIPFQNPVSESNMRQELYRELLTEAPYIVREALAAYCELEKKAFQLTQADLPSELRPQDSRSEFWSVEQFLDRCCTLDANAQTATDILYDAYCTFIGRDDSMLSKIAFSRHLSEHLASHPDIKPIKRTNGTSKRGYLGICLK